VGSIFGSNRNRAICAADQIGGITKDANINRFEDTSATAFFHLRRSRSTLISIRLSFERQHGLLLVPAIQEAISGLNKDIPLEFHTLANRWMTLWFKNGCSRRFRFLWRSRLLAMIGLYGALSYLVN